MRCSSSLWQHPLEQLVGFPLLDVEFFGSLSYQVLQVVGVLFQHFEHGVDDVHFPFEGNAQISTDR